MRERAGRTLGSEQRDTHGLSGAFFDRFRARIVVESSLRVAGGHSVDLDSGRLKLDRHGDGHRVESSLRRGIHGAED